jgi:hypothetical protein
MIQLRQARFEIHHQIALASAVGQRQLAGYRQYRISGLDFQSLDREALVCVAQSGRARDAERLAVPRSRERFEHDRSGAAFDVGQVSGGIDRCPQLAFERRGALER